MKSVMKLFLLLTLFTICLESSELRLTEAENYELGYHLSYFEDVEGKERIDTIRSRPFKPVNEEIPSFGFTDSVYWFTITLIPDEESGMKPWWLTVDYSLLEHIELFGFQGSGKMVLHTRGGRLVPYEERELAQRQFVFALNELNEPLTLYLKVKTQSSMQVPLQLKTAKELYEDSQGTQLLYGLYYGVFLIIILYNVIMYVYTKENDYLRYLFFISSFIGWQLTLDGFGIQYIWSDWQWMIEHGGVFWMALSLFSSLLFSRYFLRVSHYFPVHDTILKLFILASVIMIPFTIMLPYGKVVPILAVLSIIVPIMLLACGVMTWRQHYRPARFYVVGWSVFLLGSVLLALNKLNIVHGFYLLNYAQQVGSALEMIFLSWALADRIRLLQGEYVEKLNSLNTVLHARVNEALEHAREKDRIMMNQSRLAAIGEMIEQIAHQWRQPLNTMALLNQDLYFKQQLGKLDEKDIVTTHDQINSNLQYMSKTIDDFRNLHLSDKVDEAFAIEDVIEQVIALNDASLRYSNITCHIHSDGKHVIKSHKNELIQIMMNMLKNSRDAIIETHQAKGWIDIDVEENDDGYLITVEDNGGGISEEIMGEVFDPYFTTKGMEKGSGIGLFMSRSIIEENFHGSITVQNGEEGARFTIRLPKAVS